MPLSANTSGVLSGSFTIPADVPAGTKLVEFRGAGGTYGSALFTGQGTLIRQTVSIQTINTVTTTRVRRRPRPAPRRVDPLAQTFTLAESRYVSAVDLKFVTKGGSSLVSVEIRECENGIPTQNVLVEGTILSSAINTSNTWTRATFEAPVFLQGEREYAIVVLTDDANHSLAVGELGKFDSTQQKWVTSQPYTVGVLLSSSNASTWTPHQEKDLVFRLIGANFTSNSRTVSLGTVAASNVSDLVGIAAFDRPTASTGVTLRYILSNGTTYDLQPGDPLPLDARLTDTVTVQAILSGNSKESPLLLPGTQTVLGNLDESATYISRQLAVGTSKTIKVIFDAIVPGTASVTPAFETATAGTYTTLSSPTAVQLGDGLVEYSYTSSSVSQDFTRVRLTLTGNAAYRPRVRNLRVVVV